jgi:hypothetical protein
VRTFIPKTNDHNKVDVQLLSWPADIPARTDQAGKTYDMPVLKETKRFAALRDGDDVAWMEVIPGFEVSLVGNPNDPDKSVKHKFAREIVKGLSSGRRNLYAAQLYGPGLAIRAINDDGVVLGITRVISRTEGTQYRFISQIPSPHFPEAANLDIPFKERNSTDVEGLINDVDQMGDQQT